MTSPQTNATASEQLSEQAQKTELAVSAYLWQLRKIYRNRSADLVRMSAEIAPPDLKAHLLVLLRETDFTLSFIDAGMPNGSSFNDETLRIIKGSILPYVHPPNSATTVIHEICESKNDFHILTRLLPLVDYDGLPLQLKEELLAHFRVQVINAIKILSYRIAALGMDEEVYSRVGHDDFLITPFMEQNQEVNKLLENLLAGNNDRIKEDLAQTRVMIKHCRENIALIDKAAVKNGTSLKQTFVLRKLELLLARLHSLLAVCSNESTGESFTALTVLLREVILAEIRPQKLTGFISRNINLIAYRVTENKRKTGEHYIAFGEKEYWELFISACGGGVVVSLMVILKLVVHQMGLPAMWECLCYGILYAIGFVIIHIAGFTLATKQPAMTAATIAASMDDIRKDSSRYHQLTYMIAAVSRSQIISFAGNLLVVFPLALLWSFFMGLLLRHPFISPVVGEELINSVSPIHSFIIWYAALTGGLLFIAGLISGFGDNKVVVSRIAERIEGHRFLKRYVPQQTLHRFAAYIGNNLGPLMGNIALGFMLGFTTFMGKISGLPFDIRHITFSTGNVALGLLGVNFSFSFFTVLSTVTGVFIIGALNFLVSFLLALQIAARSRGLHLKDYPDMFIAVLSHFVRQPRQFFLPEKTVKPEAENPV